MKHQTHQKYLLGLLSFSLLTVFGLPAPGRMPQENGVVSSENRAGRDSDDSWIKQAPEGSNAEIMMPSAPRLSQRRFKPVADEPFIRVRTHLCASDGGQIVYTMSYHDLHKTPTSMTSINTILESGVRGTVALVLGSLESKEKTKVRQYHGRKFTHSFAINDQSLKSDAEVYLIGKRQYLLSVIFKEAKYDPEISAKYFASFNPFDPEESLAIIEDEPSIDDAPGLSGFSLPQDETPVELK